MRVTRLAIVLTTVGLLTATTLTPNAPALATETAPPASEETPGSPVGPDPEDSDPASPEPEPQEGNDLGGAELPSDDAADPATPVDPSGPAADDADTPGPEEFAADADSTPQESAEDGRVSRGRVTAEESFSDAPVAKAVTAHDGSWMRPGWRFTGSFPDPTVLTVQESGKTVYYAYGTTTSQMRLPILRSTDLKNWYPTTYSSQPDWEKNNWNFSTKPYNSDYAKMYSNPGYYDPRKDSKIPTRIRQYTYANAAGGNHPRFVQELQTFLNVDGLVSAKPSWAASYAGGDRGWNTQLSWAPGVAKIGDTYFAYMAVRAKNPGAAGVPADGAFCIALATSTKPGGPFAWANNADPIQCQPSDPGGAIDPEPVSYGGKWYLLWKGQGHPGVEQGLYAQQINTATGKLTGKPVTLLKRNMSAGTWEQNTIENPSMETIGGTSYLLYSGGDYHAGANNTSNYATGYAVCPKGPTAPCQRPSGDNRLMRSSGGLQGPGGASLFAPSGNQAKVAYHAYTRGGAQGVRTMRITNVYRHPNGNLSVNGDSSMLFVDVPKSHKFYTQIKWLADRGITTGDQYGRFRPSGNVSRSDMAAFLYRYAGSPKYAPKGASPFADVTANTKFAKQIRWMYDAGLATGAKNPSGGKPLYMPNASISREAMAAFLYRLAASPNYAPSGAEPLIDINRHSKFYREIRWMYDNRITTGIKTGARQRFEPKGTTRRDAFAAFLMRYDTKFG